MSEEKQYTSLRDKARVSYMQLQYRSFSGLSIICAPYLPIGLFISRVGILEFSNAPTQPTTSAIRCRYVQSNMAEILVYRTPHPWLHNPQAKSLSYDSARESSEKLMGLLFMCHLPSLPTP
jgi:hypothetical protein